MPEIDEAVALHKPGFDFIACSADAWTWGNAVKAGLAQIRTGRDR